MNICYLADDFSKVVLPSDVIKSPEALMNADQIQMWVYNLRRNPLKFATTSLYLLRELDLEKIPTTFIYHKEDGDVVSTTSIYDLPKIEILQRELAQSDKYMKS